MKPKLLIVTGSEMKYKELSAKLSEFFECEQRDWNEPEIQGKPEEILKHKMARAYELFKEPVLVDDVSTHIEALNGFPGAYMKDFFDVMTPYEMGNKFAGSKIKAICYLGLCRGSEDTIVATGEFNGKIVKPTEEDHKGRWYDIFVQLDGAYKTMIELSVEEKNEISHRGKAMKNLLEILKKEKE
jgi:non-canonical purine NTP pyrophosphatase (RdgB/HAM1 family)